ncbi:MAG: nucleotide exchange factor GrpE [Armatimonadetes bacterium]|nr:nucleotide exchange factor GrpE [Armatimonadota bacterium]
MDKPKDDLETADTADTETTDSSEQPEAIEEEVDNATERRLLELEQQLVAKHEDYLRAVADLQNFRRRSAEERAQQLQYANEQLIAELLPVLDNFDRATGCTVEGEAAQSLHRGICMVRDQLYDVLTRFGVAPIPARGAMFDPAFHEAVERVVDGSVSEGTIVEEVLPGYTLNGRVIRPAKVKVAVEPHD